MGRPLIVMGKILSTLRPVFVRVDHPAPRVLAGNTHHAHERVNTTVTPFLVD